MCALQVAIVDSDNQSGNYFRVGSITRHPKDKIAIIQVEQYKDKATRDAGAAPNSPMTLREYSLGGADYDTYFAIAVLDVVDQNPAERMYVYLKTLDGTDPGGIDFTTAVDVPAGGGAD